MLNAVQHVHAPSALTLVGIVSLAMLLMAGFFLTAGVVELLGVDPGVTDVSIAVERLF